MGVFVKEKVFSVLNDQVDFVNGYRKYKFRGKYGGRVGGNLQLGRSECRIIKNKGRENFEGNFKEVYVVIVFFN